MTALTVEGIDVRYGPVHAVRGLSLEVNPGEIVGLIGPNGAGKSSTLHAIMGATRPAAGSVRLGGRELVGSSPEDVARSGIALVPEGRRIFPELSVEENLRLGLAGRRGKGDPGAAIERAFWLFPVVREFRKRHAGALSGGQQQQLAIARALVAEPVVLLLDEPSLGLAPKLVDVVFEALAAIRDSGLAVLLVEQRAQRTVALADRSHVLAAIRDSGLAVLLVEQRAQRTVALADRSHVLANGELRLTLGPADADDTEKLIAAYLS